MPQQELFKFVQTLARDLNGKQVKLPSFADVVVRIRTALDDSDTTAGDIANILSNDAVLASRVLILANANYRNPTSANIESVEAAISRVGFEELRTAAIIYAIEQLHSSENLGPLKNELRETWATGLRLAALSEAIARHCSQFDGDSAFIAGLLNRIGVLYIFKKYGEYPNLLKDPEARQDLIDKWAAPIGESIVDNWNFSPEIKATLNPDEEDAARRRNEPNLVDVVTVAKQTLQCTSTNVYETSAAKRLQITEDNMQQIMETYQQKLDLLASAVSHGKAAA